MCAIESILYLGCHTPIKRIVTTLHIYTVSQKKTRQPTHVNNFAKN